MTMENRQDNTQVAPPIRPWYREPWPWVAIALPAISVIMGITLLYLALTNPDYLVVEEQEYREIKSELRAQLSTEAEHPEQEAVREPDDGDR